MKITHYILLVASLFLIGFISFSSSEKESGQQARRDCSAVAQEQSDTVRDTEARMVMNGYSVTKEADYNAIYETEYQNCLREQGLK